MLSGHDNSSGMGCACSGIRKRSSHPAIQGMKSQVRLMHMGFYLRYLWAKLVKTLEDGRYPFAKLAKYLLK